MQTQTQSQSRTQTQTTRPNTSNTPRPDDLDALAALDSDALFRLYAEGRVTDVTPLAGAPQGRMLAVRALDHGAPANLLRTIAGSKGFPWGGKSFQGSGARGAGFNRAHLFGRHQLFPFLTHVAPSAIDGSPCVVLDYDLPDNPSLIRAIHDEVREVSPGLYLGPAMWKTTTGPRLVLWFALDTRIQASPIGTKEATA